MGDMFTDQEHCQHSLDSVIPMHLWLLALLLCLLAYGSEKMHPRVVFATADAIE